MRRAARIDRNQPEIVRALRKAGATVQPLHAVGKGCPDILVGYRGRTWPVEIKDGSKPPSERRLTPDQREWHDAWAGGRVYVVSSEQEVEQMLAWFAEVTQ